jgi:predicted metal-dependent peptidase
MKTEIEKSKTLDAKRLSKAKCTLLMEQPFFGNLIVRLPNLVDESIPTARTDGKAIYWNPQFFDSLSDPELRGVLAHEVLHIAHGHTWRISGRDPFRWNVAADKAINQILKAANFELPEGCLWPESHEVGKSAEEIYAKLKTKNISGGAGGNGLDPGGCGGVFEAPAEGQRALEQEWKIAVTQAAMASKSVGKLPAGLERLVNEILNPKVPWSTLLRDFIERTARNDYSWSVPNRRHLQRGFVLPSLVSDELPEIVLVNDTSGSRGQAEMNQFCAEASGILGQYNTTIHVLHVDTDVAGVETLTKADLPLKLNPSGGGGTNFDKAFEWVKKSGIIPAALIYLTDGYTSSWGEAPEYPVIWIMDNDRVKAPFGETIVQEGAAI